MFEGKVDCGVSSGVREQFCRVLSIEPAPEQEHTVRGGPGHVAPPALQVGLQLQGVGGGPGALAEGDAGAGGGGGVASAAHQPSLGVGEPGYIYTSTYLHI